MKEGHRLRLILNGPPLALWVASRRLLRHGFASDRDPDHPLRYLGSPSPIIGLDLHRGSANKRPPRDPAHCHISWHDPASRIDTATSEAAVQALTGIMHVHGMEAGKPKRLGIELASVNAGLLATHGSLALCISRLRGGDSTDVKTSVVDAGLLSVAQYIVRAACSENWGDWVKIPRGCAAGPPFVTRDGDAFELEVLDPIVWRNLWLALGVDLTTLSQGWALFVARYSTAVASLPFGFHEAIGRLSTHELEIVASEQNMSISRVRRWPEATRDRGLRAAEFVSWGVNHRPEKEGLRQRLPDGALPLEGLVVIESCTRIQGPLAGLLLQHLGARVIRVEPPGGDIARIVPPCVGHVGALFFALNRGKEAVQIDLASTSGRDEFVDLIVNADVFLQNWRSGKAEEWRLCGSDLLLRNPRLVYCNASGWGPIEKSCPPIGTEFLVQAFSGLGDLIYPDGEPGRPSRMLLVDVVGGLLACEAVLAGLVRRFETGWGVRVESSLLAGAMALQAHVVAARSANADNQRRDGRPAWGLLDHPLRCLDGWLAVTAANARTFRVLADRCGVGASGSLERLERKIVARLRRGATAEEWVRWLRPAGISCARVRTDLSSLHKDTSLASCFESRGGVSVPRAPWTFA